MAKGYTAFKMKVGRSRNNIGMPHRYVNKGDFNISFEEDMARVAAVRETIGQDAVLMIDMNCTWDVDAVLADRKIISMSITSTGLRSRPALMMWQATQKSQPD